MRSLEVRSRPLPLWPIEDFSLDGQLKQPEEKDYLMEL